MSEKNDTLINKYATLKQLYPIPGKQVNPRKRLKKAYRRAPKHIKHILREDFKTEIEVADGSKK